MLVPGVKEWFGKDAELFMELRNTVEGVLRKCGFNYFYAGIVSKKSIYEENISDLGENFINNCISFMLNGKDVGTIISPEGTFRVYDYLNRKNKIKGGKGKVFYSQEFLRNESFDEVQEGKTISFWQTGFEIYGYGEVESSIEALEVVIKCFEACKLSDVYYRVSDKRIIKGLVNDFSLNHQRNIFSLIDKCKENGSNFIDVYKKNGGKKEVAEKIGVFLDLGKNQNITFSMLDSFTDNSLSHSGIDFLKTVIDRLTSKNPNNNIKVVPFIPKSWDACDNLLFDVCLPDYKYAVAGGGNLCAYNKVDNVTKSGAGIGVTRLTEYLLKKNCGKEDSVM